MYDIIDVGNTNNDSNKCERIVKEMISKEVNGRRMEEWNDPHIASKSSVEIKKINEMKEGHKDTNNDYDDYDWEGCNASSTSSSTSSSYAPGF